MREARQIACIHDPLIHCRHRSYSYSCIPNQESVCQKQNKSTIRAPRMKKGKLMSMRSHYRHQTKQHREKRNGIPKKKKFTITKNVAPRRWRKTTETSSTRPSPAYSPADPPRAACPSRQSGAAARSSCPSRGPTQGTRRAVFQSRSWGDEDDGRRRRATCLRLSRAGRRENAVAPASAPWD
jgi:hypothetical protein